MSNILIKNAVPVQENFQGNGAVYHGYAGMPDYRNRVYSEELCELEAKRVADMRLKLARTYYQWYAYNKETGECDWDNATMQAFYRWCERMKKSDTEIMLSVGWWLPSDLTGGVRGHSPFYVEGDWDATVLNYAKWVSEEVHQLIELRGFTNIKYLVLFTEPNNRSGKPDLPPKHQFDLWKDCAVAVDKQLKADGRRHLVKLMGPNVASLENFQSDMLEWFCDNAFDTVDVVSAHSYHQTKRVNPEIVKTGIASAGFQRAGGRICQTVSLKGGKEYTVTVDVMGSYPDGLPLDEKIDRCHKFGAFEYEGKTDLWSSNKGSICSPVSNNSVAHIYPTEITPEYKKISTTFMVESDCTANIGFFYDFVDDVVFYLDSICLTEKGSDKNLLVNGNFENLYDNWYALHAGGVPYYHIQWDNTAEKCRQAAKGKEFCFDEYNEVFNCDFSRKEHGMEICSAAVSFMNAGLNSSLLWTLFDQQWPNNDCSKPGSGFYDGDHRWGTMPLLTRSLVPYLSYYAFGLISKFVDRGSKVYKGIADGAVSATMAENSKGEITIIAVNGGETPAKFKMDFEKAIDKKLNRHLFDPNTLVPNEKAEMIKADKVFDVADFLGDTIPPNGVVVYTNKPD